MYANKATNRWAGMDYKISDSERAELYGLPYLQQLLYFRGIRPYMDFENGRVGMKRKISYQSLREELFVEPHPGYRGGSPSKDQVRRAVKGLERMGLIQLESQGKTLQMICLLAQRDTHVRKKAAIKPPHQAASKELDKTTKLSKDYVFLSQKTDRAENAKAATPPVTGNYFYFLWENFEILWDKYPEKKSKQKAWEIFQALRPSASLFQVMLHGLELQCVFYQEQRAIGQWVPNWKYLTNWLEQRCWEDELSTESRKGNSHGNSNRSDVFWESCKSGDYDEESKVADVIQLADYQNGSKSD